MLVVAKKSLAEEQYQDFEVSGSAAVRAFSQPCPPPVSPCSLGSSRAGIIPEGARVTFAPGPMYLFLALPGTRCSPTELHGPLPPFLWLAA